GFGSRKKARRAKCDSCRVVLVFPRAETLFGHALVGETLFRRREGDARFARLHPRNRVAKASAIPNGSLGTRQKSEGRRRQSGPCRRQIEACELQSERLQLQSGARHF